MSTEQDGNKTLFWGCFIALIATAFGFIARMFLIGTWAEEFGLDPAQAGRLAGIGIWPFAVSIILFSLVIDKIGYKTAMFIAFLGHVIWAGMGIAAYFISQGGDKETAYSMLFWGSLILALANGTVEAFINPLVATLFSKNKSKWLNILHAGWPGGLVLAGLVTIFINDVPWWIKVGLIAIPAVIYLFMLLPQEFPRSERETAGVSYREMLAEFGILGAGIVGFLTSLQLMDFFPGVSKMIWIVLCAALVIAFGLYTRSLGRPILFVLCLLMIPLATTEIGTDGWITGIMEGVAHGKFHPGWVLVYTSAIMLVLRFFAGSIFHKISPLALLAACAALAIVGLTFLSGAKGLAAIFLAATLYGVGKTFFWPTMLGVVSEQTPKGGALTMNAIGGIGMLAVGTLGFPYIGVLQTKTQQDALAQSAEVAQAVPGIVQNGELQVLEEKSIYEVLKYNAISDDKVGELVSALPADKMESAKELVGSVRNGSNQKALRSMAIFPAIMLAGYLGLLLYFKARGGYKPVDINASH